MSKWGSVAEDGTIFVDCMRPLGKWLYKKPHPILVPVAGVVVVGYTVYRLSKYFARRISAM